MKRLLALALALSCSRRVDTAAELHQAVTVSTEVEKNSLEQTTETAHQVTTEAPVHEVIETVVTIPSKEPGAAPKTIRRVRTVDRGPKTVEATKTLQNEAAASEDAATAVVATVAAKGVEHTDTEVGPPGWVFVVALVLVALGVVVFCVLKGWLRLWP